MYVCMYVCIRIKLTDLANSTGMVQLSLFDVTYISQVKKATTHDLDRANSDVCVHLQLSSSGTEMNVKGELKESSILPSVLRQSRKYLFECLQDLMQFAAFCGRVLLERQRSLLGVCVSEVSLLAGRPCGLSSFHSRT